MVARSAASAGISVTWTMGAAFLIACGSAHEAGEPSDTTGGRAGESSVAAEVGGAGAGGTGDAGDPGNSSGANAGVEGTAGTSSSSGGEASAGTGSGGHATTGSGEQGAAGSGGRNAAGSGGRNAAGSDGTELPAVGDGELDETCMQRSSLHTSGSRIVELVAVTSEDDRAFLSFYDTEKLEECLPALDAEGTFRCLPPARDKDLVNVYYLDSDCTQEAHYRGLCSLDYQAIPVTSDPCDGRRRLVQYGEPVPNQLVYRRGDTGACESYGELNNLHAEGPELIPSEYAELEPVVFRGVGRLWTQGFQGDGGLRIVTDVFDDELGERCGFARLEDGDVHCAPKARGKREFTDSNCEQTLLSASSTCGAPLPRYMAQSTGDSCNPASSFVRATAPYEDDLHLLSCEPATDVEASVFSTEPAPASDFVALETTIPTEEGRLLPIYRTAMDGGCFFEGWWDEVLQTECSFTGSGSTFHCLPEASSRVSSLELFADSACETPVYYLGVRDCDGATPPPFWIVDASACRSGFDLRALDPKPRTIRRVDPAPVTLPPLWTGSSEDCMPYTPDSQYIHYAAGDVVPNDEFMAATLEP